MFKINAMDHIVLNVPDINHSLAFYMDVLGLAPERLDEFRRGEVRFPSVRISADTVIDLFPMKPGEALGDGPGLQSLNHFTMVVDAADFEGFQKHLAEHGVKIEEGPARRWGARGNGQSVYFRDPDGNRIEVRCYPLDASDAVSKGDRFGEWAAPLAGRRDTMIVATDRRLYISTDKGLFQARSSGRGYTAQSLAFDRYAPMRWPVVVDSDNPRRLYAGTSKGGVFRSDDAGQSWREINQGIIYKEIWSVVQHPRTGELYVGTGPASVFKSLDRGESWIDAEQFRTMPESIDWTFPPAPHIAHVKGLALCASDPRVVFGAVEEGWLVRSCDGGVTWETLKNGTEFDSHYVALMPDDPAVILATSGNGFYRSTDGGDSFVRCTDGLDRSYFAQPVIHPARPNVVFTAASAVPPPGWRRPEGADAGFYRSEDQGLTWRRLTGGLPVHITAAPRSTAGDPESPDVFVVGMNDGTVWITEDGGESFHLALSGLPPVTAVSVAYA